MTSETQELIAAGEVRKAELIEIAMVCLQLKRSPRSSTSPSSWLRNGTPPVRSSL